MYSILKNGGHTLPCLHPPFICSPRGLYLHTPSGQLSCRGLGRPVGQENRFVAYRCVEVNGRPDFRGRNNGAKPGGGSRRPSHQHRQHVPQNVGLLALAEILLAPGIKGHSIIAIDGNEQRPEGDDGVVKYTSAHVGLECIVRSGHSCQGYPLVIEEVRRILLEHLPGLSEQQ
jgi:hypothetical protein